MLGPALHRPNLCIRLRFSDTFVGFSFVIRRRCVATSSEVPQQQQTSIDASQVVTTFVDLKPFLRQFIRRVHPDVVHAQSDAVRNQNHEAVLQLDSIMDAIQTRCSLCTAPKREPGILPILDASYMLKFYWLDGMKLRDVKYVAKTPLTLDSQTRLVISKAIPSPTLHGQWLELACKHVSLLLAGVGVPCQLVANKPQSKARRKVLFEKPPMSPTIDVEQAIRDNLVQWSPLQQGKSTAFPGPRSLDNLGSVFSKKQRQSRIATLFSRGTITGDDSRSLSPAQLAAGKAKLAQFMVDHFDRCLAYHDAWFSISVRLCTTYMYVPSTRTLYVPGNFEPQQLAEFLDTHLPGIVVEALETAKGKAHKTKVASNPAQQCEK